MVRGGHPVRLPVLRGQVEDEHPARSRLQQGPAHGGQDEVGQHRAVPGAGAQDHPVGPLDGLHGHRVGLGVGGHEGHVLQPPAGGGHGHLAADALAALAVDDVGLDDQRRGAHGHDAPVDGQQPPHPVQPAHVVAQQLPQGQDEQVAQGVVVQLAVTGEAVLEDVAPGQPPLGVVGERGQGHPQVAGGQAAEFASQPPRGAAVVGHGDHGGQPVRDVAQGPQGGGQAVPAAQGHDGRPLLAAARPPVGVQGRGPLLVHVYSLPRSRCWATTAKPAERRRAAMRSAEATERCLPPVQPTAMVTLGLSSST